MKGVNMAKKIVKKAVKKPAVKAASKNPFAAMMAKKKKKGM